MATRVTYQKHPSPPIIKGIRENTLLYVNQLLYFCVMFSKFVFFFTLSIQLTYIVSNLLKNLNYENTGSKNA